MTDMSGAVSVSVKNFPARLWAEVRSKAVRDGLTMRQVLIGALELWLEEK